MGSKHFDRHGLPRASNYTYAREKLFYYSDGTLKYQCGHVDADAAETDDDWDCFKFVWSSGNMTDKEGPLQGAVNTEAAVTALTWNI